jgi:hypothetical protein
MYNKNEKQLRFFLLRLKHLMPQTFSSERFLENKIRIISFNAITYLLTITYYYFFGVKCKKKRRRRLT